MPALNFMPQFVAAVENGLAELAGKPLPHADELVKRQTIRAARRDGRDPKVGETLYLGTWSGRPYCSKVRRLGAAQALEATPLRIHTPALWFLGDFTLSASASEAIAVRDGFASRRELLDWFEQVHGIPFSGVVIRW